ncbi:DNA recombination protein RmuC [Synechococcus sp. KORDI-49]|uniref:DNA recombination protein RmuC n=1 Tax=Synechococcus sp. KORDI-49 TaxID=585423 RepID=UPI000B229444|nr:DNA recombination protein RmuC [Synechococcus sp. KORDI-49]
MSRTQLEGVSQERDALKAGHDSALAAMDQLRREKEKLTATMAEVAEKLRSQESQTQFLEQARSDLLTQFRSLSGQMLDGSREALLKSTKETVSEPFAKEVLQLRQQVEALQKDSNAKLTVLAETTRDLRQRSEDVQGAAQQLTSALRSPNVKGQWGEVNLRRILEFVGLIAYCDFDEQVHVGTDEGAYRPDCVITIPGSRRLIVDSKAPIESYLDALQATDQTQRDAALNEHLKKVRSHIDLLNKKDYAGKLSALGQVVDGVVLFIPVEGALSMALERDPQLLEYAFSKNIILTFPTSLLAILKGLAMTIQQAEIAKNIDDIQAQAVELHKRFSTFIDKFNDIGSQLNRLNKSFNAAVGSAQSRLLPQGRRFAELAGQNGEIDLSDQIDEVVREIQAGE